MSADELDDDFEPEFAVVPEGEELALERVRALFGAEHANVQPHAGAMANMAAYAAVLSPGDRVLISRSHRPAGSCAGPAPDLRPRSTSLLRRHGHAAREVEQLGRTSE